MNANIPIEMAGFPFLTTLLLSCLVGLMVILFIPAERKVLIRWIGAGFSGISLLLSLYLFLAYDRSLGGLQFVEKVLWLKSLGINYYNGADGFNLPLLLLTGIVHFTGVLTMWKLEERIKEFFALSFLLVLGVFGFFYEPGSLFSFCLVRCLPVPHVSSDPDLGDHPQGIRGHEALSLPSGGEQSDFTGHFVSVL
jgi:NADH-quinone oxidoreductase subunit M